MAARAGQPTWSSMRILKRRVRREARILVVLVMMVILGKERGDCSNNNLEAMEMEMAVEMEMVMKMGIHTVKLKVQK